MHQNAQGPVINGSIMALVEDYLRCDVLGSPTKCPRLRTKSDPFGKAEVNLERNYALFTRRRIVYLRIAKPTIFT